jgi:hypothetical protein
LDSLRDLNEREEPLIQLIKDIETTKIIISKLNEMKIPISSLGVNPFKQIKNGTDSKIISFLFTSEFHAKLLLKQSDNQLISVLDVISII